MMGVGLRIERLDLAKAGAPVQMNRLLQRMIRLQPEGREPELARLGLQRREHPPAQAQPTDAAGHPHSFEVSDPGRYGLHPTTGDRLAIHESDEERAARRDELTVLGRQGGGRIEPRFEAPAQLLEVLADAPAGRRACRIDPLDLEAGQLQELVDLRHGGDQPRALRRGEQTQKSRGGLVGGLVHRLDLPQPGLGQPSLPDPPVRGSRAELDETLLLEGSDQTADVAGIEPEALAQVAEIGSVQADLVQQTRLSQGAVAPEEMVVQSPGALRDEPVEAADLGNLFGQHSLTIVNHLETVKEGGGSWARIGRLLLDRGLHESSVACSYPGSGIAAVFC